jgi:hypothetical protein
LETISTVGAGGSTVEVSGCVGVVRRDLDRAAVEAGVDVGEHLVDIGVAGLGRGVAHRGGVLPLAHGLDFLAQLVELRLAGHLVEAGAEFVGHAADLADELAELAQQDGQVLGAHHDQGDRGDDQEFRAADITEHGRALERDRFRTAREVKR